VSAGVARDVTADAPAKAGQPALPSPFRRLVEVSCLALGGLLLLRVIGAEPYAVPTGSMAPALLGNHRDAVCPRCGFPVHIGLHERGEREHAFCPNCGCQDLELEKCPPVAGDRLLVNKGVFDWRRPRRWEMAVFRCPADRGRAFVKRVVGLPDETVQVRDGDVYIDHELARKTLDEFKALRLPVFDYNHAPRPGGWQPRWEVHGAGGSLHDKYLALDTAADAETYQWLVYRNARLDDYKTGPVYDECPYNGREDGAGLEAVHDFDLECDLEVAGGDGWVALGITDGHDDLLAELPVGALKGGARVVDRAAPPRGRHGSRTPAEPAVYRAASGFGLRPGKTYHVELAFVDRRLTLAVDGVCPLAPVDRPAVADRGGVVRPVRLGARGADVRFHNFRLFRDVHYTETGRHGVAAPVRLGAGQYFVLGDNSPNSDDNRFWSGPDGGPLPVREGDLLGKPFLVHLPSRAVRWEALGRCWEFQGLDWDRVHRVR
jgi:signal peptidase I